MPKFVVRLRRYTEHYTEVEVDAPAVRDAHSEALALADDGILEWEKPDTFTAPEVVECIEMTKANA